MKSSKIFGVFVSFLLLFLAIGSIANTGFSLDLPRGDPAPRLTAEDDELVAEAPVYRTNRIEIVDRAGERRMILKPEGIIFLDEKGRDVVTVRSYHGGLIEISDPSYGNKITIHSIFNGPRITFETEKKKLVYTIDGMKVDR